MARHGSVSRAAEELNLSQPAVSMQVKQLEEQIALRLIEYDGKRMALTEAGRELRGHARRISDQLLALDAAMDQFRDLEKGLLRLWVVSTANYFLPRIIAEFSALHPGVRVSLTVANRDAVIAALNENLADLAITGQPPDSGDLDAELFMENPLVVIAAPGHPLAGRERIALKRLGGETLVLRESGSGTRAAMDRFFAAHGVEYRAGGEFNTNEAIKQAVQAGLGLGVAPAQTLELEVAARRLVILPVEGFPILRHWYVVRRGDRRPLATAEAFHALLVPEARPKRAKKRA